MNTGGGRLQQQAPLSRVAAAPLILEPRPAAVGHDDALIRLQDLWPTAALARQVTTDRHAAPSRVHRECCLSKARS